MKESASTVLCAKDALALYEKMRVTAWSTAKKREFKSLQVHRSDQLPLPRTSAKSFVEQSFACPLCPAAICTLFLCRQELTHTHTHARAPSDGLSTHSSPSNSPKVAVSGGHVSTQSCSLRLTLQVGRSAWKGWAGVAKGGSEGLAEDFLMDKT